ncbi:LptF/LptG family permease [Flavobacterium sp.]|uniref:LptF/LptG family permease n=1 Tax=Flavobacterium sp. TaxID=239 RepID=UPI00345C82F6
MKIIDKYLLKTFLITFTTVFVILFFIFILQTVWLFISELAGKDLEFLLVVKFLLFSMPRIVPLVLPLSVLLSSIMTFGSLAENYEFAAMKSSGISFQRSMRSITVFIFLLSILSFFFANNVIPYAEYKFINFRRNIAQVKPAMAIAEGQFSEVGYYTIKVDKKLGEKGNLLSGVTIHRKLPNGEGNTTVIKAKRGELISSEASNTLKLVLTDGHYYEDIIPKKYEERNKIPFAKGSFKRDVINIDLSKLNQSSMDEIDISNTNTMLNLSELRYTIDSLNVNYKKDLKSYTENIYMRTGVANTYYRPENNPAMVKIPSSDLLKGMSPIQKSDILKVAFSNIENTVFSIDTSIFDMQAKLKSINKHWIAYYDKFMIAFSCLLMFFIGAPLGSIIRKGGLGLPIVFAVSIFIIFHFINTFGKRVAQEDGMTPFMGVWMSSIVLTPLAILLTYRAINDIGGMISFDAILMPIQKLFKVKTNVNKATPIPDGTAEEATKPQIDHSFDTKAHLLAFNKNSTITSIVYFITLASAFFLALQTNVMTMILFGLAILMLSYFIFKEQKIVSKISTANCLTIEPGLGIALLTGFPFYPLLWFYTKSQLRKLTTT